ncbi:MAG: energy-coupling factor transporter transmembrane protein EcfT [Anaerolineales bacterium]|nr:energy-coupling factor transporter transmembrane protein EcfT [Anaerolineales bacterium]MBX3038370.1 energy-coupling factor transporter transmembrane protein EcfT [Anaerolineales bacterium]
MLVTWKYRPRNTFIQRLDPRTRLIFMFSIILALTVPEIWDFRIILPLFFLSLTLYLMARIEWKDVRRVWIFIFILVIFIVGLNGLLSGRGGPSSVTNLPSPVLFNVPIKIPFTDIGWDVPITVSKTWFALTQITRMFTMTLLAIPIPYTIDPNIYGTAFRRMGASDKVSFTMDLAFRFLPTFARDFIITMDAQRARGYEIEKLNGGIPERLRKLAPFIIPVVMQSTVTGEEVIDAMDLRAFGTAPRTWLKQLTYALRDYFILGLGFAIFVACCVLKWGFGFGGYFVPEFFSNWILGL